MSGFNIDQLVFDASAPDEGANTGAFVRAANGDLITSTIDDTKIRLDVSSGAEHNQGEAHVANDKGSMPLGVDEDGNYQPFRLTNDGELKVDVSVVSGADKNEDDAHISGATGAYVLSVREDILASSTSASGDYQSLKTDARGAMWAHVYKQAPSTANLAKTTIVSVTTTAIALPTIPLANRTSIIIQNNSKTIAVTIGFTNGITATTGPVLKAGGQLVLEVDASVSVYGITSSGSSSLAIIELAHS